MNEEHNAFLMVPKRISKERFDTCVKCKHFRASLKQCKLCHCFMQAKVQFQDARCPDGQWGTWKPRKTTK
jgi:hypothetical protein